MALVVQKFGGTSVKDAERVRECAKRVISEKDKGNDVVVVVSAPAGMTDDLIRRAKEITDSPNAREMDMLLATGEQVSIAVLAMALNQMGYKAISFTGPQVGIKTDTVHTKARIVSINEEKMQKKLKEGYIVVVAGFQGVDENQDITTLGRGGSDTTAVALAAALKADLCDIYTDVDGVYTADPRIVPNARKLKTIAYDEMLELASLGAKVMQSRSIEFAKKYEVPVQVRSSYTYNEGTLITKEDNEMEKVVISGIACDKNEAKVSILGVPDQPGIAAKLFSTLAKNNLNIDMIIQNTSASGLADISFTVPKGELKKAMEIMEALVAEMGARGVNADDKIAKVSAVGVGMRSHPGVAAAMFEVLADNGINIQMINTSEIRVSCVIDADRADDAMRLIHEKFKLSDEMIILE